MRSVSVVMPALNEENNIESAIKNVIGTFDTLGLEGEIVVVNDGSADGTEAIIKSCIAADPGRIKMVKHQEPQGIGASFWDGATEAKKDSVVMLPGDGENDAAEILRYMGLMDHVDIIVPYVINKNVRSRLRNLLSALFLFSINVTFGLYLNYTNGTIVYKRDILRDIKHREKGFFYQVEALVKTIKKGCLFAEVPYRLSTRAAGASKAVSFKSLRNVLVGYFSLIKDVYIIKK
jgi:dolichol-phosphate mannosyltransferase